MAGKKNLYAYMASQHILKSITEILCFVLKQHLLGYSGDKAP